MLLFDAVSNRSTFFWTPRQFNLICEKWLHTDGDFEHVCSLFRVCIEVNVAVFIERIFKCMLSVCYRKMKNLQFSLSS